MLPLELTELRGAFTDTECIPGWMDRAGDSGVEFSDEGPPTLLSVVVDCCVEEWWKSSSELVVLLRLFAVTEGDLFIYTSSASWKFGWKMEIETKVILIILVIFQSWSRTRHGAQKEEIACGKKNQCFPCFLFCCSSKIKQNHTKQTSWV